MSHFNRFPGSTQCVSLMAALALGLAASSTDAQWVTESPVPTHLDVRGVGAIGADHVFIASEGSSWDDGGSLFESTDGGATWTQRDVPFATSQGLNGLFFLDASNGWAFGNANYRTDDGGASWSELPFLGSTYFMEFYTTSFGLASGNFGVLSSLDGGTSWAPSPQGIFAASFYDTQVGLGASDTGLYRTTDGGGSFGLVQAGAAHASAFFTSTDAVAVVDTDFFQSSDGGATWSAGQDTGGRNRLEVVSSTVGLAWGRSGTFPDYDDRIFRTTDGGGTWSDLGEVIPAGIWDLQANGSQSVVAVDLGGNLHHSTDGGASWTEAFTSPGFAPGFLSSARLAFADEMNGYFGYGPGLVIRTVDGGATWNQVSSGIGYSLEDIGRFADGSLIAVGENGTVVLSSGISGQWLLQAAPTGLDLVAVDVVGPQDVVALDEEGRLYASTDGGQTWTAATAPSNLDGSDMDFVSLTEGWVIGSKFSEAVLYYTDDGGQTWTPAPGFLGAYVSIDFEGDSGWAANSGGTYYRTIDAGETWIHENLPGSPLIEEIEFWDVSVGYAVGRFGYAMRSDDGGLTWQSLPIPAGDDHLTDVFLLGPNELWVSTNDGRAYYSATGGQNWSLMETGTSGFGNFAAIVASPDGDAWAVGFQGFIERFDGPPPPPLNRPPEASFDFVTTGLSVDLTDTSVDPDGTIVDWLWDFGDGQGSTEQNPSHTFDVEDTYIVRLTVTDDDGDTGSAVRFIVVQPGPGGTFGDFTEVTPLDPLFLTPQDEDFWVSTTAAADYDNDGDLDIAVLGYYVVYHESVEYRLVLIRNDGEAGPGEWEFAYVDVPLNGMSSGSSDMAWGDVDGDGDKDLVLGSNGETVLYRNDDGVLTVTDTVLPSYYEDNDQADFDLQSLTWADFDNDGDQDLLMPSVFDWDEFTYRTALLRNEGSNGTGGWNFVETSEVFESAPHAQSMWADYDGDLDLDLLLINLAPLTNDGFIRRYRNDGNGAFVGEDILGALTIEHGEAHWGDYDEDGDFDVLVAGHIKEIDGSFNRVLRIYRNDDETYVPIEVIDCIPCEGWFDLTAATWADYDADGDVDILLTGTYNSGSQIEGRARIYRNDGGTFVLSENELPAPRASGRAGGTFSWFDLDGDLDLDYFIAGEYFVPGGNGLVEAQMHAYRNDVDAQNQAPAAPSNLAAVVGPGGEVSLSWDPAVDDQTPSIALTYDLEVYGQGTQWVTPRRLPEPGNVSAGTQWALSGLPDGAYQWSLRAVDSSFNGGVVAEGSFQIGSTTDTPPNLDLPARLALSSFPNPATTRTTMRLALPQPTPVRLTVFDVRGREVSRIADATFGAGVHDIEVPVTKWASGTYYLRLQTPEADRSQVLHVLR